LTRSSTGTLPTDEKFTGQRLDQTGLYFYNARYYDPAIGRFISADSVVQNPADPQSLNRYSYCLNNPLKYTDPSGNINWGIIAAGIILVAAAVIIAVVASPVVWGVALTGFSAIAAGSETMLATADVIMATAAAFGIPAVPAVFGIGIIYNGFRESTNVNSSTTNTSTSNESNLPLGSNSSVTTSSPSPPVIVIQINSPTTIGPQDPVTIGPYNPTTIGPQDQSYDNSNNVYVNYNLYYGYDT
jgi:RHS repeat-associated protein